MRWTELAIFRRHVIADLMTFNENVLLISEVLIYNRLKSDLFKTGRRLP